MHRHFFVAWEIRKYWIPHGLVDTLKAAVTYKIDASTASDEIIDELEVFLCGKYRFGTYDVVELLDAIEPPLQDKDEPSSSHSSTFYTRLVFLLDTTRHNPLQWSSPQSNTAAAQRLLEKRSYPWLRSVDLILCAPDEFDAGHVAVAMTEGLTMLVPAVRAWWAGDRDARPELVVKGLDVETARTCANVVSICVMAHSAFTDCPGQFARSLEEDDAYSCVDLRLLGTDLARNVDLTAAFYVLQSVQYAYVSLRINNGRPAAEYGSTVIGGLDVTDRCDEGGRNVSASVCVVSNGEVHFVFNEERKGYEEVATVPLPRIEPTWAAY